MPDKVYCSASIYGDGRGGQTCGRKASRLVEGEPRCFQHLPEAVKAREEAQSARIAKEMAVSEVLYKRDALRTGAVKVLRETPPEKRLEVVARLVAQDDALTAEYERLKAEAA